MRESIGKHLMRNWLYLSLVPSWLKHKPINDANFLVLLGEEGYELPLLKLLGVRSQNIWSIENDQMVFDKQIASKWPVSLYQGDANEFLNHLLLRGTGFDVLNLDIEGSYYINLDPGMATVFSFLTKNTNAILCTYNTMCRDQNMILEGLVSLYIFLWLLPELTTKVFCSLMATYQSFGCSEPDLVVLRDFFIIRSYVENSIMSAYLQKKVAKSKITELSNETIFFWQDIRDKFSKLKNIADIARKLKDGIVRNRKVFETKYDLVIVDKFARYVYRAVRPWSQLCYFSTHTVNESCSYVDAAEHFLNKMATTHINFTDWSGSTVTEEIHEPSEINLEKFCLVTRKKAGFLPRSLLK